MEWSRKISPFCFCMRLLQQRICSLCMCRIFPLIVMGAINNYLFHSFPFQVGLGRVVRGCWVNFQCRGVLLIWIIIGQGPIALAVGAGGVVWTFFSHLSFLSSFSLSPKEREKEESKNVQTNPHPYLLQAQ